MRRLLYIPIIHSEVDLGSAGASLAQEAARILGEHRWQLHQKTVEKFWESVATYLGSFDAHQLKVYQDGLPADGQAARHIVEEAASRGSQNYRIILGLVQKGAELRKTEDPSLLLQERENVLSLTANNSAPERQAHDRERYQQSRDRLMAQRDVFIAQRIDSTLTAGEIGVLFIGAYHEVSMLLPKDISVEVVKDAELVKAYFSELLLRRDDKRLEELAAGLCLVP